MVNDDRIPRGSRGPWYRDETMLAVDWVNADDKMMKDGLRFQTTGRTQLQCSNHLPQIRRWADDGASIRGGSIKDKSNLR